MLAEGLKVGRPNLTRIVTVALAGVLASLHAAGCAKGANVLGEGGGSEQLLVGGFGFGGATYEQPDDCIVDARDIYLLSETSEMYRFYPPKLEVERLGPLLCQTAEGAEPYSMAVARDATGYVLFTDGSLFSVTLPDLVCTPTTYATAQQGWTKFGMGFVSEEPGTDEETLFVTDATDGRGLGIVDIAEMKLIPLLPLTSYEGRSEVTGNGAGRLNAFLSDGTPRLVEIDPHSGNFVEDTALPKIEIGRAWAFAFWGGAFYLFTAPASSSQIDKFDVERQTTKTILGSLGFTVVGAGVSTCAPITGPR